MKSSPALRWTSCTRVYLRSATNSRSARWPLSMRSSPYKPSVTSLACERLFRQPMNSYSTQMNGHGCQSADGKWTAGVMETTAGHQMRVDTAASPSSSKTGSPSSSQVSNCLRPTPTNALKTQYTTSLYRGTCSRRLLKKLDMFHVLLCE